MEKKAAEKVNGDDLLLHLQCVNGRIVNKHTETADADSSIICFSNEALHSRCHHVRIRGKEVDRINIRNVRWTSERKLTHIFNV